MAAQGISILDKYWDKWIPEPNTGCYIWLGHASGTRSKRPAAFWEGKKRYVARVVCEEINGHPPFPKAEAAHTCQSSLCVSPGHLYWATRSQNEFDKPYEVRRLNGVAWAARTMAIQAQQRAKIARGSNE